ncbi:serine hydrolase-like protein [Manduca sexta]|uniref:AB hydrolase-1 domain-containing protein n=1 Tax=Manduca sexta TaxID=7130 RepID=A0A921ZM87_MANSE|nr:serine hydrolase-like protein [Manduca sexta]KAG6460424.1 hypothetical protein O3G_MSEX011967 [Manduca sexta]KAG6460425.1 hypothetical protein O3G_MSEX011967 [Manduca sexta]
MSKMKDTKEWTVNAPWGRVAMISWGDAANSPVLLVHGYADTAATFIPLVKELPNDHYYVAFDMPGHGKSDPFPPGVVATQLSIVEVIRLVVDDMRWESFVYIAHSMGAVIGLFYNYVYPDRISKMVLLDPGPPLSMYYFIHYNPKEVYHYIYNRYYDDYKRYNSNTPKLYSYEDAVNLTVSNRNLTTDQTEVLLSRALVPVGDMYRFSMEPRMKFILNIPVSEKTLHKVVARNTQPTLLLEASRNNIVEPAKSFVRTIFEKCQGLPNYWKIRIKGGHDFHITDPAVVAKHVKRFLNGKICVASNKKCKL